MFSSRRRHTSWPRDWSSDVCSSDLGLVVVLEVHPAGLAGHVVLPLAGVAQHGVAAGLVEGLDAHLLDLRLVGDAQLPLGLELGGQAVGVPAEAEIGRAHV